MSANWKTVLVFISSTFRDMQAERDWLVRFVFPRLREELVNYRIHFVDVDLRWGVTSDQNALGVCREVIDECHPRFMCILGGRYGWVPEGREDSITADEVHYGVLGREAEKRGHAFFYFREEADTLAIPEADARTGGYREFALLDEIERHGAHGAEAMARERADKLDALKKAIISAGLPVFPYHAEWSAHQQRLTGLKEFGDRVFADLLQSFKDDPELAARFTSEGTAPPDEFAEEAEQMDAFIEERSQPEQFIIGSREPLLRDMLAFATANCTPNIFVLTGEPGSGKSALLAKFTRELTGEPFATRHPSFVIPHFIGASTGSTDLRRTLRRLCHELARAAGNTEPLPLDIKELITHFQKLLAEAAGRRRIILVFDALNQFDATDGAHWLNWLPLELPPGVRIVASVIAPADGQPEHQTLAILRTRPGTWMEKLEPLTDADTFAVIEGNLRRYAKRLSPEQLAAFLAKPAGRLPLYVLTALEELRTLGTYDEITDRIRTLPGDARALFGWILTERLARDPGFRDREGRACGAALVEKFAACLAVSRHGLSPAELAALLDPGDPLGNVAALLRLLRPYLMRRGELLDFYHGQFREAAETAYLKTPENQPDPEKQRAAHQSIAVCLKAFADPHRDDQYRDATPNALSELPHHQTRGGEATWPDLIASLENIFFLEAKVTHGMAFDLADDFTAAGSALPLEHAERQRLRLLDEALRRDIHFIARHAKDYSQALFQCLWNTCWWYDCPERGMHFAGAETEGTHRDSRLNLLMEEWRRQRDVRAQPRQVWLRSLRPPVVELGGPLLAVLRGHQYGIQQIVVSPDGRQLASVGGDEIVIWDLLTGARFESFESPEGPFFKVWSVAYSNDGNQLVTGCGLKDVGAIRLWDIVHRRQAACLTDSAWAVGSVDYSKAGSLVAAALYEDNSVHLWNVAEGREERRFEGGGQPIKVRFSPDGRKIVSGSGNGRIQVWDIASGALLIDLCAHHGSASDVAYSHDGHLLISCGDSAVCLIDSDTGDLLRRFEGGDGAFSCAAISANNRHIVAGDRTGSIVIWDARTGQRLARFRGHDEVVRSIVFLPDCMRIASGSSDCTIRIWDHHRAGRQSEIVDHEAPISSLMYSPDGRYVITGSEDASVRVWDGMSGAPRARLAMPSGNQVNTVALSPDGRLIAAGGENAVLWAADRCVEIAQLGTHYTCYTYVKSIAFSRDSQQIAFTRHGAGNLKVEVWSLVRLDKAAEFDVRSDWLLNVVFSRDGRKVAALSQYLRTEGSVCTHRLRSHVWDSVTGEVSVTDGHEAYEGMAVGGDATPAYVLHPKDEGAWRERTWLSQRFPRTAPQMSGRDLESVVAVSETGEPIAFLAGSLDYADGNPMELIWAGCEFKGSHLLLFALER